MQDQFSRTRLQWGEAAMNKLAACRVAVFGIGGVGGACVEALARSGIGGLDLFDDDTICLTNLNRQIIALHSTVGQYKVDVMQHRVLDINPACQVEAHRLFWGPDTEDTVDFTVYDYVVDAVDTVTAKLGLITKAQAAHVPVISAMGAGNKLNPAAFEVSDIYSTTICPLARIMRKQLRRRGVSALKVVYSREVPMTPLDDGAESCRTGCVCPSDSPRACTVRRQIPSSNAFVPAAAGLLLASEVVRDLSGVIDAAGETS